MVHLTIAGFIGYLSYPDKSSVCYSKTTVGRDRAPWDFAKNTTWGIP